MTTAYPLAWPIGWARTARREKAAYRIGRKGGYERGATDEAAKAELLRQLRLLARRLHPDVGGERGPWDELQAAIHQARQARNGGSL